MIEIKLMPAALSVLTALALPFSSALASETFAGQMPVNPEMTGADIIAKAYEVAGGETWRRPQSLVMTGYSIMYRNGEAATYDDYRMWREYDQDKKDAHKADGKVKIQAKMNGKLIFVVSYDGETTYDINGPTSDQSDNARWSSNFGFGAIRHALDDGWTQKRLPDDLIDGRAAHLVELNDPAGGTTRFGFDSDTYNVLYVGFDTPRGWHERRYSEFFTKTGIDWVQPGRVRLFYDGVKQNEVIWTDFEINKTLAAGLFVIEKNE